MRIAVFALAIFASVTCQKQSANQPSSKDQPGGTTKAPTAVVQFVIKLVNASGPAKGEPVWEVPVKIWYKDSAAIEEVASLNFTTSPKNNRTTRITIDYYRYVDLRKRSISVYNNFSDTAGMVKQYSFEDKSERAIGGWQFNTKKDSDYIGEPERLADTTISETTYARMKLKRKGSGGVFFSTLFFTCTVPTSPFMFYNQLSKQVGCPAVKFISDDPGDKRFSIWQEINFLRYEFEPNEAKVFEAWARNAGVAGK